MTSPASSQRSKDAVAPPSSGSFVRRHASILIAVLLGVIVALIVGYVTINPLRSEHPVKMHGTVVSTKEQVRYHRCGKTSCKDTYWTTKVQLSDRTVTVDESDRIGDASPVVVWRVGDDYSSGNPKSPGQITLRIVVSIVIGFVTGLLFCIAMFLLGKWRESRRLGEPFL